MIRQFLSQPNGFGMFAQLSNEFGFGEQYMPNYVGDPAGTQQAVNNMLDTMYPPGPSGCPTTTTSVRTARRSSGRCWACTRRTPVQTRWCSTAPGSRTRRSTCRTARRSQINAPGASATRYYVQGLKINDRPYSKLYVPYSSWPRVRPSTGRSAPSRPHGAPPRRRPAFVRQGHPPGDRLPVQPAGDAGSRSHGDDQVGAQNTTASSQTVHASVAAPSGLHASLSPPNGDIHVPPNGSATVDPYRPRGRVHAADVLLGAGLAVDGRQPAARAEPDRAGGPAGQPARRVRQRRRLRRLERQRRQLRRRCAQLLRRGTGRRGCRSQVSPSRPAASPTPGRSHAGFPRQRDAAGQKVTVNAPAGTQQLGFLGAASGGPSQGVATLTYSDGSTARYWLGLSDWTLNGGNAQPSFGNQVAATTTYRNCARCAGGHDSVDTDVFSASLPVDATKTLASVTLPSRARTAGSCTSSRWAPRPLR